MRLDVRVFILEMYEVVVCATLLWKRIEIYRVYCNGCVVTLLSPSSPFTSSPHHVF